MAQKISVVYALKNSKCQVLFNMNRSVVFKVNAFTILLPNKATGSDLTFMNFCAGRAVELLEYVLDILMEMT